MTVGNLSLGQMVARLTEAVGGLGLTNEAVGHYEAAFDDTVAFADQAGRQGWSNSMADRHLERLEGLAASGSATGEAGRGRRRALRMPVPLGATGEAGIRDVVASIDAGSATGERDLAIILLSHCTGLRGIDIRRLKPTDIDRRGQSVSLTQSKNHGPITCALNGETMSALADYVLEGRPDCDRFLPSLPYESGGRIGEVLALKAGDLRPTGRGEADVHFYGKGNKHRVAPLASDLWRHHSEFERACHPGGADPSDLLFYARARRQATHDVSRRRRTDSRT